MAVRPIPIVVVSVASESGELVLAALDAGAVDFVQKPTALATDKAARDRRRADRKSEERGGGATNGDRATRESQR